MAFRKHTAPVSVLGGGRIFVPAHTHEPTDYAPSQFFSAKTDEIRRKQDVHKILAFFVKTLYNIRKEGRDR